MPSQPQRFSHLLKPLQCTEQDNKMLLELAETLVVHNIEQFNALQLGNNGAPINKSRWKEVRKKEGTKVFKECATKDEPLEMPSLMLLGSVVGKLEDFMYAVAAPSTEAMRVKSAIVQDGIVDCMVLHDVVRPTMDDPFHHISVRWRLFAEPYLRDHVCLDSTGIATSANGEQIGYHLTHSVGFEQVPSFDSYDVARGNISVCSLYVQNTPSTVQVYARGFFDFNQGKNELVNNGTMNSIASEWMSYPRKVDYAQVKKLLWTMHKSSNRESIMSLSSDEGKFKASTAPPTPGLCKVCSKSFGFLGTSRKSCRACNEQICARCSVTKTMAMVAPNRVSVMEKKRVFCVQCINDVVKTNAVQIAREEILNIGKEDLKCVAKDTLTTVSDHFAIGTIPMKSRNLAQYVPQLHLVESDVASLRELADKLVTHNLQSYNTLISDGQVDTRQWKELRRKDGIRVYKERSTSNTLPCIPSLLLFGTVAGILDDVLFVAAAATDEQMKVTSTCLQDGVLDSKVLQSVVAPTVEQPFRHVGVKWRLRHARDYVCVDTTGIKGEVGYSLSHSVAFAQIPTFEKFGVERANMSVCWLFRQKTPDTVECYAR
ncbi:hypothetical protein PHMEG_00028827, partial [Phytophthora megakarya]